MTNQPRPDTGPMLFTDCPLCDRPAPIDETTGALDCPACAIRLELADDPHVVVLAPAA
jgi:hypothetical protein